MQVKRNTLIKWCVIIVILLISGGIFFSIRLKDVREKREMERIERIFDEAVEREYHNLLSEYKHLADMVDDYDYSYSLRYKYAVQLLKLIKRQDCITGYEYSTINNCLDVIDNDESEIKETLKRVATQSVYNQWFNESDD